MATLLNRLISTQGWRGKAAKAQEADGAAMQESALCSYPLFHLDGCSIRYSTDVEETARCVLPSRSVLSHDA